MLRVLEATKQNQACLTNQNLIAMLLASGKFASREEMDKLRERLGEVEDRLGKIERAFEPATRYALFEAAIYEAVTPKITSDWDKSAEKIKHSVTSLCHEALQQLASQESGKKKFQWGGPSTSRGKNIFPKTELEPLLLAGIQGAVVFIQQQEPSVIRKLKKDD